MGDLSETCFYDRCTDCGWPGCTCLCHRDQEWDPVSGWVTAEEDDDA